jgi:tripartite-type tricarboxylate transporter receptor subunit TctC
MPDTVEKLQNAGVEPISSTPEQFSEFLRTEIVRWTKVIKEANVTIN